MAKKSLCLTVTLIQRYAGHLCDQERSAATIQKYVHDLTALSTFLDGRPMTKGLLLEWKEGLIGRYAPASVNAMLAAVNRFLTFLGRNDLRLRPLKIQRALFLPADKELTRADYIRLVQAAQRGDNARLALVIQTICATGIRVSELRFITVEAVQTGRAEVVNKGKRRAVFLPEKLRRLLKGYLRAQKITAGAVFLSRRGNPLDRSNIWRDMKRLCDSAGVEPGKVFPHNLRHLFARCFYRVSRDVAKLADVLGHSSIETTRIYLTRSSKEQKLLLDKMVTW